MSMTRSISSLRGPLRTISEWPCQHYLLARPDVQRLRPPFDRTFDRINVGSVRLDRNGFSATAFNRLDYGGCRAGILRIRDGHACSIGGQTLCDRERQYPWNLR